MARDFSYSDDDFELIRSLLFQHAGISLAPVKKDMVYSRLVRRLRHLEMDSFAAYCQRLQDGDEAEFVEFVNALTTNLTAFFRENHHFEFLANTVLPELLAARQGQRRIRIWSAGCSTGEEPYSIAMVVREAVSGRNAWDIKILATDLDSNVLEKAQTGIYGEDRLKSVSKARKTRFFEERPDLQSGEMVVGSEARDLITFKQLNLMESWPMKGPFDVIFCRNVVIYFDKDTQRRLFERYAGLLADDGYLIIGHSESLYRVTDKFELLGNTIYQKAVA